ADHSLENALLQVEEEQQRRENLAEVNTLLREHLDKASEVNSALKEDVGKLTADWMRAREELELKESEWRSERELYDSYVRGEHNRLLSLWRQVVTFRRHFLEMKTATDRDLSELKAEQMRLSGSILVSCSHLNSCVQLRESITLGKPVLKDQAEQQVEPKIDQTAQEVTALQVRWDMEKKELQDRVMELSALLVQSQKQNEEKEKTMKTLNDTVEILESSWIEKEFAASLTNSAKEENLFLQKLIKNITEVSRELVQGPHPCKFDFESRLCREGKSKVFISLLSPAPSWSAGNGIGDSSGLFILLSELCLCSDCEHLEKTREELQQQLGIMEREASCLHQSNAELLLKEESAQAEKAEQQERMERVCREQERLMKDLAALEEKHSSLQHELVVKRQAMEKLQLQKDLLEQEKDEFAMALEKAERSVAELTGAQNKLNAERADLQAAAAKMSSINEALALDKVQLNKHVWQVSGVARDVARCSMDEMERAKISEQEKLNFCERANEELCTEKARLKKLLKEAEEQREELWMQLRTLGEEKAETQEKLCQSSSRALEQLRWEFSGQGQALAQVCREKELLHREKAALERRLAATERHRQDLSKQLAEARSEKESLESSLVAAQQQISQLEITRNHLEAQVLTVTQAKEAIEGEVKCLQHELEAERAHREQEREHTAQQLRQAEQQCHESLRIQGTAQQQEINRLLQDLVGHNRLLNRPGWPCGLKRALSETLLQTQGELSRACQQIQQLRQEAKEQQEKGQVSLSRQGTDCRPVTRAQKAGPGTEEARAASGPWSTGPRKLQSSAPGRKAGNGSRAGPTAHSAASGAALSLRLCSSIFQIQALQEAVMEKEASQATREKQLLQELEESRAGEQRLRDSVHVLEAEVSELRVKLQSCEGRAEALATQCQQASGAHWEAQSQLDKLLLVLHHTIRDSRDLATWSSGKKKIQALELELSTEQAQRDSLRASNQELQKQLDESREGTAYALPPTTPFCLSSKDLWFHVEEKCPEMAEGTNMTLFLPILQHERDRLQADKEKLECEIKLLEESVTASETRANTATDKNQSLEQELQTSLSMLKIKNEEVQNQGKKIEILQKEAAEVKALQEHLTCVTAILSEREGEMKLYQEQMRMLEKQKEMHKTALNQVIKDITEKEQKTESQQEQIQELEKQQEKQNIVLSKMSKELEEKDQEIRSQQLLIEELENKLELQNSTVSRVSKELEERHLEIKFQEEKIMILEQHGTVQVRNLLVDLDDMKGNLREKRLELLSLTQLLRQQKEQQDRHLLEVLGKVETMTLSLSEKDQELESQRKQMQEVQEDMEMQLRTVCDKLEQTLATLKEKDTLMDIQKQQTRTYEEKTEEQINVLYRDLENSRTILREKDLMIESQKELIETFQKQKQDSEQQKQILQHLQVELKEKEQEIFYLRKQCEACKEKEENHEAEQRDFQATTLTLKEKEEKIKVLEETITKLQQQKEETAMQTKAILQKLKHADSSLEARDQEIASLQEHVQNLREQKEVAGKQAKSLEQDLDKVSQMLQKNHLEFVKQTEQMNTFQLREDSMKVALTSCQKQVTLLEEVVRKKDEDNDTLRQKLQHLEEELKTLQNLQLRLTEENEEARHDGKQEKLLKEAFPEREGEIWVQSEQKQKKLEEEIRALQEDLQRVQETLTKKDKEVKYQTDRVNYLEKTLIEREHELRRQSELLKELTLALRWKDEGETLKRQIQKLQKWEEEEIEKRKIVQERDHVLQRQKEIQQLEAEREANGEELEHVAAALEQRESRENEWRRKAQGLSAALSKSEMANGNLKKNLSILQKMVLDTDRFHQQVGTGIDLLFTPMSLKDSSGVSHKEVGIHIPVRPGLLGKSSVGEQLSLLSEKRLMLQSLECLQRAVAGLEDEKVELKLQNTELRRTLEQVKRAFAVSTKPQAQLEHDTFAQAVLWSPLLVSSGTVGLRMLLLAWACLSRALSLFQVSLLQSQLARDRRDRQSYIESCSRTSQELSDLHQELSCSFAAVLKEPKAAVLEEETRKLDQSLSLNSALASLDHQSLERQPEHPRARPTRSNDDLR
uniref:Centrosomal protein 250 n=1 Tax=Malurus cyaneus samueli TaxID=2593467 RepID=A0A8C5TD00_9PASS